jgi:hypothetical protein
MRGINSLWARIRLNLEHVPEDERPAQEPLEVDYDPFAKWRAAGDGRQRPDDPRPAPDS